MTVALYATIWAALGLFAAGEAGRTRFASSERHERWAWAAWTAGALLAAAHLCIALDHQYGWDHDLAASETARRAEEVYGYPWRGSIYVNYVFVLAWLGEAWRWHRAIRRHTRVSPAVTWVLRAFFLTVIANGAIVFAVHAAGRAAGVLIVAVLLWSWTASGPAVRRWA